MDNHPSTTDINFLREPEARGQIINAVKNAGRVKNQVIDGFIKAPSAARRNITAAKGLHSQAEKAQTLMRGALKKPANDNAPRVQAAHHANPQRELRARKISKTSFINRFGAPISSSTTASSAPATVLQGELVARRQPEPQPTAPQTATAAALPSMVVSASHQKLEKMLDQALTNANSHKQAMKYQAARHFWQKPGFLGRRRGLKLSAAAILVLAGGLFVAWKQLPVLSVKVAAMRAHIHASVPGYKPEGYQLASPAQAQAGSVVLKYKAPDNSSGFDLAQQKSDMTSTSLAQTVVPQGKQVQTSHVEGTTVYIYGANNDAAWVNNGVLYTIKDKSKLNSDQILKIVQSLD